MDLADSTYRVCVGEVKNGKHTASSLMVMRW
jgi:hypothetical protein